MKASARSLAAPSSSEVHAAPWVLMESSRWSPVAAIFRNEIRRVTDGFRFPAFALLSIALMALAAITAGARYRGEMREQQALTQDYAGQFAGLTVDRAVEILHPALKPPWRLDLVVDGGQTATPDVYAQALSALVAPEIRRIQSRNYRLPNQEPLDWMFVIRVVLPLAAFLLGYDAVYGERRDGTLKLLFSYPVARWKVMTGKLLALWSCLAAPFLTGAALSLLLALGLEGIPLQPGDLVKAGLVVLLGLWAAGFFALISLLVSSVSRESSTSLSVLAWLWVMAVIVVPAVSGLLAHRLRPIPSEGETALQLRAINQQIAREYTGREGHWRRPEWAAADGYAWERASAAAENRRHALEEGVRRQGLTRRLDQVRLARSLASLSPVSLVQELAERLTGSGLWRDESFLEQARRFRSALAGRIAELDRRDPESPHILFFSGYVSRRPIGGDSLPRFAFREQPVRRALASGLSALGVFALETAALAAASLFIFSRVDTGDL
ncbi:MAG TPA: ABC transporter permease subunit [Thermoanaerobaculia bacterium]|nr:ABC transporter permease subunit [Thermoanaerobaculia bacterium]